MSIRGNRLTLIVCLLTSIVLWGCLPEQKAIKPITWKAEGVVFDHYTAYDLVPAFNATGQKLPPNVLPLFDKQLAQQLTEKMPLPPADQDQAERVITVRVEILEYISYDRVRGIATFGDWPGWAMNAHSKVLIRLSSRSSGKMIGEILTFTKRGVSPVYMNSVTRDEWFSKLVADHVAINLAKFLQQDETKSGESE